MSVRRLAAVSFLVGAGLAACGPGTNPTVDENANKVFGKYCSQLKTCDAATFANTWQKGMSDCVNSEIAAVPGDHSKESGCSSSDESSCEDAIGSADCGGLFNYPNTALPDPCAKCLAAK